MVHIFGFIEFYVAPFIFAIGLVLLLYGVINYFVIGPTEEDRREVGRQALLWAAFFFLIGFIVFAIFSWLFDLSQKIDESARVETERGVDTLSIPNVPRTHLEINDQE